MKNYFILLIVCLLISCKKEKAENFTITADIRNLKDNILIKLRTSSNYKTKVIDSTYSKDGRFNLKFRRQNPGLYDLIINDNKPYYKEVWFNNREDLLLKGDFNNKASIQFFNSPENQIIAEYRDIPTKYEKSLSNTFKELTNPEAKKTKINELMDSIRFDQIDFCINNANFKFSINEVIRLKKYMTKEKLNAFFDSLNSKNRNSKDGELIANYIKNKKIVVGEKFIDFVAFDLNEKEVVFSDFQGKIILLDFMANWCVVCHVQNKEEFTYLHKKYKDELVIVTYSVDDDIDIWKESVKKDTYKWNNISNLKGLKDPVAYQYGVHALPHSFLIDKEGIIRKEFIGYKKDDRIEKEIIKMLSK